MLGAYREAPLLGLVPPMFLTPIIAKQVTTPIRWSVRPTPVTIGPAPFIPVSRPTTVLAPAPVTPPVIAPMRPSVFTETPNMLPPPPMVPTAPGSSPMTPAPGGGEAGVTPTSTDPSGSATAAAQGMPGWILPAAAAGLVLLFFASRRRKAASS
jgi:hypothetical protein